MTIRLSVNGADHDTEASPDTALLYVLRNDLGLNGPKFGCGLGQCGACTVIIDGEAIRSCVTPIDAVGHQKITTLEGIGREGSLHPLQTAFIAEQAVQCGYCGNGMIMGAKALLDRNADPSEAAIREALSSYLCRCGVHNRIVRAIRRAAKDVVR